MISHPSLSQMSGYTPGYGTVPGWTSGLPWTYYLLDGGSRQHAVYEGRYLMTDVSSECDTGAVLYWVPAEYLIHGTGDVPYLSLLPNGDKRYRIQDNLGSTRVVFDSSGAVYSRSNYEPFGKAVDGGEGDIAPDRLSFIGKEQDTESDLGDFGVRKYDEETGRFLSVDLLWEKYRFLTPYHYSANNPLLSKDPTGLDSAQRAAAIEKAEDYVGSGSTYKMGAKGQPGDPVDCSGLVSSSVKAGGERDPNRGGKSSGVLNIESSTEQVETNNVMAGNIVTFRTSGSYPYHTGLVVDVGRNDQGDVQSVNVIHSSSSKNGPTQQTLQLNATKGLGSKINGFYKWDTRPDPSIPITPVMTIVPAPIVINISITVKPIETNK